jgi:hypothetical protein
MDTILYGPERHEALTTAPWREADARAAIVRWVDRALADFDDAKGGWPPHPREDGGEPGQPLHEVYGGAGGAIWALEHLAEAGAIERRWDFRAFAQTLAARQVAQLEGCMHRPASFLIGEAGLRLLEWKLTRDDTVAQRLFDVVEGNLDNPVREALWGSSGTALAAIAMAEHTGEERWIALVQRSVQTLWDEMEPIEAAGGAMGWVQNLYGRVETLIGAAHGFVGNVYPAVRGAAFIPPAQRDAFAARALRFLQATALRGPEGVNWWPRVPPYSPSNKPPMVQDCHGAPGIVCRLAPLPRSLPDSDAWDELLLQAGELTWRAGPLSKGVCFCHGTAGSAHAMLQLFARTGDELWLQRARALALHGIGQVERERDLHGQGRHTLWTGDLGMACVLWDCITGRPGFPTLDRF